MKRKINFEALFQLIIIFGCAAFLAYALISGGIKHYVHPRLTVFLWISVVALIVIGIFLLPNLFKPKHSIHLTPYVFLMIPMLTAVSLPANAVNNQTVSFESKTVQEGTARPIETTVIQPPVETQQAVTTMPVQTAETSKAADNTSDLDIQIITDDGYIDWYTDCYDHPEKYDGKTIQFKAKVFYLEDGAENEFIPGRLCMLCCAADAMPLGFICRSDELKNFNEEDWIIVTATVKIEDYKGDMIPILHASSLTKATPPEDEYIYFNY